MYASGFSPPYAYSSERAEPVNPPELVTAPTADLVTLAEMKQHLRVTHDAEDDLIQAYINAAMAHLDGWRGLLGRAIMPQTWQQELPGWGRQRLALPDASDPEITAEDADGVPVTVDEVDIGFDHRGWYVKAEGPSAEKIVVSYSCEMPDDKKDALKLAVMLIVGHWYANREAVGENKSELPLAFKSLIAPLRWQGP